MNIPAAARPERGSRARDPASRLPPLAGPQEPALARPAPCVPALPRRRRVALAPPRFSLFPSPALALGFFPQVPSCPRPGPPSGAKHPQVAPFRPARTWEQGLPGPRATRVWALRMPRPRLQRGPTCLGGTRRTAAERGARAAGPWGSGGAGMRRAERPAARSRRGGRPARSPGWEEEARRARGAPPLPLCGPGLRGRAAPHAGLDPLLRSPRQVRSHARGRSSPLSSNWLSTEYPGDLYEIFSLVS